MQFLTYLIFYPLIKLISLQPFCVVYRISNFVNFLLYKVFKYRLKTVRRNLKLVFPDKTGIELREIEKGFYKHFSDITIESIKAYGMSKNQMMKRYTYENIDVIRKIQKKKKNIILLLGHYSNFEWMLSIGYHTKGNGYAIYTPLTNKYFNRLFKKIRKKHNAFLVSRYKIKEFMSSLDNNKNYMFGFVADQSPRNVGKSYINYFFGQKVPIFTGAERFAKDYNLSVVFADTNRVKRGYYRTKFIEINDNKDSKYSITDQFIKLLEEQVYRDPNQYFWSHNRFKHLIN